MAKRSRKRDYGAQHRELDVDALTRGWTRGETTSDGHAWNVRSVGGSEKPYRCPGCDQMIVAGTPHMVVWPADHLLGDAAGLEDRRHWHTSCWRSGRRPTRRR
ncbi:hypothetical protein [Serinibacter salmoneus]|uniref:ATP/GTP-binding protein n=1 Tax=Serinibacter salmoneus TaxID=556530 RepID=A0A2A9D0U2_9MICO|nr:hypothetical protein [Serinibacter salmoneus]PFG20284.1 hypothetical protein ATL40_1881 [Serinibacter salmoneus]